MKAELLMPASVAWPKGIKSKGEIRHQYIQAIDIVPTIYDCLGMEPPTVVKGYTQSPIEGISFKKTFEDPKANTGKETQFYVMLGTRGIWHNGWYANTVHPAIGGWSNFNKDTWELYNLEEDRNQMHDLADKFPDKLEELKGLWYTEAGKYNGLPLEDRTPIELILVPRPQPSKPRDRYIYYPDIAGVPESVAVSIHGRSYNIAAEVEIKSDKAEGVLFAHGGRFGGHTLYVKDGKLNYVYNWLGEKEQKITSNINIPTGKCILGIRFRKEGQEELSAAGMAALYINNQMVAEAKIQTQPGLFAITGAELHVGKDVGEPASSDYESPFEFTGGVIKQVIVDVSGERFRDLEKELQGMLMRD